MNDAKRKEVAKYILKNIPEIKYASIKVFCLKISVFIFPVIYIFLIFSLSILFSPFYSLLFTLLPAWHYYFLYIDSILESPFYDDDIFLEKVKILNEKLSEKFNCSFSVLEKNYSHLFHICDLETNEKHVIYEGKSRVLFYINGDVFDFFITHLIISGVILIHTLIISLISHVEDEPFITVYLKSLVIVLGILIFIVIAISQSNSNSTSSVSSSSTSNVSSTTTSSATLEENSNLSGTFYNSTWQVNGRFENGIIYNENWHIIGHYESGTIYNENWYTIGHYQNGTIYNENWHIIGYYDNNAIYNENWHIVGHIS